MIEFIANFHFLRPLWLLALAAVVPAGWLLYRQLRSGKAWSSAIAPELLPHLLNEGRAGKPSQWPLAMLLTAWLVAVIALAGPSWERLPQPVERRENALVVLYDLSRSMYATDVPPSRLVRSRQKLLDLLETRTEGTTALVAYAGDAHVVSPLTDDLRTIANLMPALSPDIMPVAGSRPGRAAELAVRLFRDSGQERGQILLVTDGIHPGDGDDIAGALAGTSYRLSVMGVGTRDGSPIPTTDGFLRDAAGTIVVAGLERGPLRQLAARFGGSYTDLELGDADIDRILAADLWSSTEPDQVLGRSVDTWEDMGYWLAILLLPVALAAFRRGWVLGLPLLVLPLADPVQAQGLPDLLLNQDQRGQRLLEAGQPEAAAETFDNPDWAAAAHYRAGNYRRALEHYSDGDTPDSWYNRGNSLARSGKLEEAIAAYDRALEMAPDMEDAAFNKSLLEQLLEQQQQQQAQQDSQEQDQSPDQQQGQPQAQDSQQSPQQEENDQQQAEQQQQQATAPEQNPAEQQQARPEQTSETEDSGQEQARDTSRDPQEMEREMANEQWLRRIPDDPSGLLRRKFEYEARLRAQQNPRGTDDNERW